MIKLKTMDGLIVALSLLASCDTQNTASTSDTASNKAPTNETSANEKTALSVEGARMMAPPPGKKVAAVYLTLNNPSLEQRQIFSIETDVAGLAEVHRTMYEDGVMRMRQVDHVRIAPKSKLDFEPQGLHIMLMQIEKVLEAGDQFNLYFEMDKGETLEVPVSVQAPN